MTAWRVAGKALGSPRQTVALTDSRAVTLFALLLAASVLTPVLGVPQPVTGTVVNATLLVATVRLGPGAAIGIATLPSLFALAFGQLPPPLAPMVPFIIIGNVVLVGAFHTLRRRYWIGAVVAAGLKSAWLFGTTALLVSTTSVLPGEVGLLALAMMGWPQLFTALAGGVLAFGLLRTARGR